MHMVSGNSITHKGKLCFNLFYFFKLFFINWVFYIIPFPNIPQPTSINNQLSAFIFFLKPMESKLCYPHTHVCGCPLEHGWTADIHIVKENRPSLAYQLSFTSTTQVGMELPPPTISILRYSLVGAFMWFVHAVTTAELICTTLMLCRENCFFVTIHWLWLYILLLIT